MRLIFLIEVIVFGLLIYVAYKYEEKESRNPYGLSRLEYENKLMEILYKKQDGCVEEDILLERYTNRVQWRLTALFSILLVILLKLSQSNSAILMFIIIASTIYLKSSYENFHTWLPVRDRIKMINLARSNVE